MSEGTSCCTAGNPLEQIRRLYTDLAQNPQRDFGWAKGKDNARRLGYDEAWLSRLPEVVWESAAAVGNPFAAGPIRPGETVVDLGCGAGADACVAALLVGEAGRVAGYDATPAMVAKAAGNARAAGLGNAVFRESHMDELDLADAAADVVISNGAINLAADKAKVFAEAFRILRRGGRLQFADMVREEGVASGAASGGAACGAAGDSWADCVSGTLRVGEILQHLHAAGFADAELLALTGYKTAATTVGAIFRARKP